MMQPEKRKKIADAALIAFFLVLALAVFLAANAGKEKGEWAVVCVDGEEIGRYSLGEDICVSLNGGTNMLVIEDGSAWISEADCPDHLCVKQGKISFSKQCITCLPNHLTVTVEGEESDVDIIG